MFAYHRHGVKRACLLSKGKTAASTFDLAPGENLSSHGGQVLNDALAGRFNLWNSLAAVPGLDPRKRRTSGFSASAIISQMMVGFTSVAASLAARLLGGPAVSCPARKAAALETRKGDSTPGRFHHSSSFPRPFRFPFANVNSSTRHPPLGGELYAPFSAFGVSRFPKLIPWRSSCRESLRADSNRAAPVTTAYVTPLGTRKP